MRRAFVLFVVVAAAAVPASASAADGVRKGPAGRAFYTPPGTLHGKHGAVIWARRQRGPSALKGARNTLLLYRSTGIDGSKIAVSGSLAVPRGRAPDGGWPVISYAHATTGVADRCAPTRGHDASTLGSYVYPLLRRWLRAGYAVVRTDYQGLGTPGVHEYLVGEAEGRSVLDAVRAARRVEPRLSKRFVIAGHSQGGHAALFAASLARKWVPDVKLRGTVALAPPSHLAEQFEAIQGLSNPGGGLGAFVALGLRAVGTAAPRLGVESLLTPAARALFPQTLTRCYRRLSEPSSFGGLPLNGILRDDVDLGPLIHTISRNDPEDVSFRTPVRVEQGTADTTVFKPFTDQLVDDYRGRGMKVSYRTYDGVGHGDVVDAAAKDATRWIRRRLR
jgi:fermentation-respiration switch protein FrsA (DUF1100 family)